MDDVNGSLMTHLHSLCYCPVFSHICNIKGVPYLVHHSLVILVPFLPRSNTTSDPHWDLILLFDSAPEYSTCMDSVFKIVHTYISVVRVLRSLSNSWGYK